MKDFYWYIRPKPEYGTIEVRVFDTPLTVDKAAALAAYVQALARYLLAERPVTVHEDMYLAYTYNRFQACRFGLAGLMIDADSHEHRPIHEDIAATVASLTAHAEALQSTAAMRLIAGWAGSLANDAAWMREHFRRSESLADLMWQTSERWSAAT
jgi:carboxylate-amine ligase